MNIRRPEACRLRLKLRIMSDEDLWWLFLHQRAECTGEFWEEVTARKVAGTLSKGSPFWTIASVGRDFRKPGFVTHANLIELTREEWEARRRRTLFRLISA
ncbi:MAG TPA: hypothetical protein VEI52_16180 [Terriglobales bacterium]|nr:hypothetical protein [Terriglobales bacterium]